MEHNLMGGLARYHRHLHALELLKELRELAKEIGEGLFKASIIRICTGWPKSSDRGKLSLERPWPY